MGRMWAYDDTATVPTSAGRTSGAARVCGCVAAWAGMPARAAGDGRKAIPAAAGQRPRARRPPPRPRRRRRAASRSRCSIRRTATATTSSAAARCTRWAASARRATVIDRARADADAALVLEAGDLFLPQRENYADGKPPDAGEIERRARLLAACLRAHRDDGAAAGRARSGAGPAAAATAGEAGSICRWWRRTCTAATASGCSTPTGSSTPPA